MDFSRLLVSPRDSDPPESLSSCQAAGEWLLFQLQSHGLYAFTQCYCPKHRVWECIGLSQSHYDLFDLFLISRAKYWVFFSITTPCCESEYVIFEKYSALYTPNPLGVSPDFEEVPFKILRR